MSPIAKEPRWTVGVAGVVLAVLSCGETKHASAPPGWQRTLQSSQLSARGAWSVVRLKNGTELGGELLAIDDRTVFLGAAPTLSRVPRGCVAGLLASGFEGDTTGVFALSTVGILSTASHGGFLILSAPVWFLSMFAVSRVQGAVGYESWQYGSSRDLRSMRGHARFPQGLPAAFGDPGRVTIRDVGCARIETRQAAP